MTEKITIKDDSMKNQNPTETCELNQTAKIGIIKYRKVWEIVKDHSPAPPK